MEQTGLPNSSETTGGGTSRVAECELIVELISFALLMSALDCLYLGYLTLESVDVSYVVVVVVGLSYIISHTIYLILCLPYHYHYHLPVYTSLSVFPINK
jgi:hypothetical protein